MLEDIGTAPYTADHTETNRDITGISKLSRSEYLNQNTKSAESLLIVLCEIRNQTRMVNSKCLRCIEHKWTIYSKINKLLQHWWKSRNIITSIDVLSASRSSRIQMNLTQTIGRRAFQELFWEYRKLRSETVDLTHNIRLCEQDDPLYIMTDHQWNARQLHLM